MSSDGRSTPGGEEASHRDAHRRRRVRLLAASAACGLLVLWSWPLPGEAIRFPDSLQYLAWPEPVKETGVTRLGARMPVYPLLLAGVGAGPALVHLQIALSLASWALLGLAIAGLPGLVLGGLISLTPELRFWGYAALTESLSASLLALLVALGVMLATSWRGWLMGVWTVLLCLFGLMRPSNVAILPFLLAPFALQLHDLASWRPPSAGLRPNGGRLAVATLVVLCVGVAGSVLTERSGFWRMNYYTVLQERIVTDPDARAYFVRAGLPVPVRWKSEEFAVWFEANVRSTYHGWLLSRPESYREAWRWMAPAGQREAFRQRYVEPDGGPLVDIPPAAAASLLFDLLAPPGALWAIVIVLALALELRSGRMSALALLAAGMGLGAYVQGFLTYHASAAEEMRHTLLASLMYRVSFVLAVAAIATRVTRMGGRRWRGADGGEGPAVE